MWEQDPAAVVDTCTAVDSDDHRRPRVADSVVPLGQVVRCWAVEALVAAYAGDTHRLLTELADALEASVRSSRLPITAGAETSPRQSPNRAV